MALDWTSLRIDSDRFLRDFAALSQIGSTGDGGVNRPALSPEDLQARAWFQRRIEESGFETRIDPAGNQSAFLDCGPQGAPALLLGSHLDSVPHGGRFDGALGVLAALEVLRVVRQAGVALPYHLEAINFTDEEGTLVGFLGSQALAGQLSIEKLESPKCGRAELERRLSGAGLSIDGLLSARRDPSRLAGYLELHIEQGTRLEESRQQIGVVDRIVGICDYHLSYIGRADHSGTTPLPERLDAGLGAAGFILSAREAVLRDYPGCTVNVGQVAFEPGAFNIVPRLADLSLEFRSPDPDQLVVMEMDLLKIARQQATRYRLLLGSEHIFTEQPALMSAAVQQAITASVEALGLSYRTLQSYAGHDAQNLSTICPAGMIFIPSVDGASHSARERSRDQDCINGANVLLQSALRFAGL